jgi:hypothetical protein
VSISKNMWHLNIQECAVLGAQKAKEIIVKMIPGHSNIANLFTKEFQIWLRLQEVSQLYFKYQPRLLRGVLN